MSFEEKYRKGIKNVRLSENFRRETVLLMEQAAERKEVHTMKRKIFKVAAMVTALILTLSLSAFAISYLLSASEVADTLGKSDVADLFRDSEIKTQTIVGEEYTVTLHGVASGAVLSEGEDTDLAEEHSYIVLSVMRNDGEALELINGMPLQMAPIARGITAGEIWAMGMCASGLERDGVLYYLFDCASLEAFADRDVSIAVFEGSFPTADIFVTDEYGVTQYAEGYVGFRGIFPIDTVN